MARVNAPLFSFTARGQLAKSLVYSTWKGIDDVRSYAIPTNPRSSAQVTQRNYFTDAVQFFHDPLRTPDDNSAENTAARFAPTPQSGFNRFVAKSVDQSVPAGNSTNNVYFRNGQATDNGGGSFDIAIDKNQNQGTAESLTWGYSPSKLDQAAALTNTAGALATTAPVAAAPSTTVYWQVTMTDANGNNLKSGIYSFELGT